MQKGAGGGDGKRVVKGSPLILDAALGYSFIYYVLQCPVFIFLSLLFFAICPPLSHSTMAQASDNSPHSLRIPPQ